MWLNLDQHLQSLSIYHNKHYCRNLYGDANTAYIDIHILYNFKLETKRSHYETCKETTFLKPILMTFIFFKLQNVIHACSYLLIFFASLKASQKCPRWFSKPEPWPSFSFVYQSTATIIIYNNVNSQLKRIIIVIVQWTLFAVVFFCAWKLDKIPFSVSTSHIYFSFVLSLSMSFDVISHQWVFNDIWYEQISFVGKVKTYISGYLIYHQCDTISLVLNSNQAEQKFVWL